MKRAYPRASLLGFILLVLSVCAGCGDDTPNTTSIPDTTSAPDTTTSAPDTTPTPADLQMQTVGVTHCAQDIDCDDGRVCTTDLCIEREGVGQICEWAIVADTCLIGNVCREADEPHPLSECRVCDPSAPTSWSDREEGSACTDGDACTSGLTCSAGVCGGGETDTCDDENDCTADSCHPINGCVNEALNGDACDSGSLCTEAGVCADGECLAAELDCDDQDACTDDLCEEGTGCVHSFNTAPCDDDDLCTVDSVCDQGVCGGGVEDTCDDFNECTIDVCDANAGCVHLPTFNPCCTGALSVCDDQNPCTTDLCDPVTTDCAYEFNTSPCDDSDLCTENDVCEMGTCGGADLDCDDSNDCTDDSCNVSVGCISTPTSGGICDDGLTCSTGDTCDAGVCIPTDITPCLCAPVNSDASKLTTITVAERGDALDITGDGMEDNSLSALGGFVNDPIAAALTDGSLMLLLEFIDLAPGDFTLAMISSELDPTNAMCDYQAQTCDYLKDRAVLDITTCEPTITIPAILNGAQISAGGPSSILPFSIPLNATTTLDVTLYQVRAELDITTNATGEVITVTGKLGGAIRETDLNNAILAVDPASLPLDPTTLIGLLGTLAPNDIDTDGDGASDAKSITLNVTGIDGVFTGATLP